MTMAETNKTFGTQHLDVHVLSPRAWRWEVVAKQLEHYSVFFVYDSEDMGAQHSRATHWRASHLGRRLDVDATAMRNCSFSCQPRTVKTGHLACATTLC